MSKRATENREESLESRLEQLEKIIERLGEGGIPLDQASSLYQEGMQLVKKCRTELKEVRSRVEKLNRQTGGLEPIEAED